MPLAALVLNLGCGHGVEVAGMVERGLRPVGLDPAFGMLTLARQHLVGWLVQGDAARLPLHTASLDGVWSLHALLHVPDLTAALGEIARALKPAVLAALTLSLGEGVTVEPVAYQPDVIRRFVHWKQEAAFEAVTAAHVDLLDYGVETDVRTTLWLLVRQR